MKRILFVGVILLTLSACKKDWKCTCYYDGDVDTYLIFDETKRSAERICEGKVSVGVVNLGSNTNCSTSKN